MENARNYLIAHLQDEMARYWGTTPKTPGRIERIASAWMDDRGNSRHRYLVLKKYLPGAKTILDMAAGCGTFVYYGLLHGYDVYGIEPEPWKVRFNALKARSYGYPDDWARRFIYGVGEQLPFADRVFDCVSTYQTLEHVNDARRCLREMVRVVKRGGGLHLRCPDYRSTFEGHYCLPWLPLMPRPLASIYLSMLRRPSAGLATINYITRRTVLCMLKEIQRELGRTIGVTDLRRESAVSRLRNRKLPSGGVFPEAIMTLSYCASFFRRDMPVHLWVSVD